MENFEGGYYVLTAKIVLMLILAIPWLLACPWVSKDCRKVRGPVNWWATAVLAAGMIGLLAWFWLPLWGVGLLVYLVLVGAALGAYVVWRNGRVPAQARVMTSAHLQSLFSGGKKETKVEIVTRVKVYGADGRVVIAPPIDEDPALKDAYNAAQALLYDILYYRASEADLLPQGAETRVRLVIDGVISERPPLDLAMGEAVIQYLKPVAGMNPEEHRRPQQGKLSVDMANSPVDMMLTCAGTTTGQRMQIKIVREFIQTQIDILGMSSEVLAAIKPMSQGASGLIIVSGRSGSGVTSTLYSLLRAQDAFTKQLMTLEVKPVVELENMTQTGYGDIGKLAASLATAARKDPDLLMVDRCDDQASAAVINQFAARKMVLLGMQAGDSFTAMGKWIKLVGSPAPAVENLRAVLCQMLVRKLCPTCREAYKPDPAFLAKANLPAARIDSFYRPPSRPLVDEKGQVYICPTCQGNGYFGRTAVFEMLTLTPEIRALVAAGAPPVQVQSLSRKSKMLYLQEQALRKVIEGVTSIQEVIRVTGQGKK